MSSDYDATEFVDGDFQGPKPPSRGTAGVGQPQRAPTREEVDSKLAEAHRSWRNSKRAQEELERQRGPLEETRRRQMEFQTSREEMIQNLTRGIGLLEEAEFTARRDAEQMAKELVDLRDALSKVQAINEETWTHDNFSAELTRALTTLENARMEWNAARLKFPLRVRPGARGGGGNGGSGGRGRSILTPIASATLPAQFAVTWPLAAMVACSLIVLLVLLLLRR